MVGRNLNDLNQANENPGPSQKNKKRPKSQNKPLQRYCHVNPKVREKINEEIDKMLKQGIIEPFFSIGFVT